MQTLELEAKMARAQRSLILLQAKDKEALKPSEVK